jgi:TetR/AcrR family transcriptional regulator
MPPTESKISRKDQILQTAVHLLEVNPGGRITTATLAKTVGVSEAALYRHFASKTKIFENLIGYIEDSIFSRISRIQKDFESAEKQCQNILLLVLHFSEKNPGMCRILTGEALSLESAVLNQKVHQLFERIETQLKQSLREAEIREGKVTYASTSATASFISSFIEGKIRQYVRSDFNKKPTAHIDEQWALIQAQLLHEK